MIIRCFIPSKDASSNDGHKILLKACVRQHPTASGSHEDQAKRQANNDFHGFFCRYEICVRTCDVNKCLKRTWRTYKALEEL